MLWDYLVEISQGIGTSLQLTFVALVIAFILAIILTFILSLENRLLKWLVNGFITLFTGTPLLIQFFLIYSGRGSLSG